MKPILFNTEMVKAILDERKTKTRRVIKQIEEHINCNCGRGFTWDKYAWAFYCNECGYPLMADSAKFLLPSYRPGDILWVRETWQDLSNNEGEYVYLADGDEGLEDKGWGVITTKDIKWRPSIYMPKEAARIFLKVTDVRAERLQDITEEDARKEGIQKFDTKPDETFGLTRKEVWFENPVYCFKWLWDKLNAKRGYSWEQNPWVWVYTFERCAKPGGAE